MPAKFLHEITPGWGDTAVVLFPPAGRGAFSMSEIIGGSYETYAVALPGRERRIEEDPATRMSQIVEQLCDELSPIAGAKRAVLHGHSLGAYVAHAVAVELESRGIEIAALGVAGAEAPIRPPSVYRHMMDDAAFMETIYALGGTPPEVFNDRSLRDLFVPLLRADFALAETYKPSGGPVRCPIFASFGTDDLDVDPSGVREWATLTVGDFTVEEFPGDHFYPDQHLDTLIRSTMSLVRS